MENMYGSLQEQQAFLSAPQNQEMNTTKSVYVERPVLNNPQMMQKSE